MKRALTAVMAVFYLGMGVAVLLGYEPIPLVVAATCLSVALTCASDFVETYQ